MQFYFPHKPLLKSPVLISLFNLIGIDQIQTIPTLVVINPNKCNMHQTSSSSLRVVL